MTFKRIALAAVAVVAVTGCEQIPGPYIPTDTGRADLPAVCQQLERGVHWLWDPETNEWVLPIWETASTVIEGYSAAYGGTIWSNPQCTTLDG